MMTTEYKVSGRYERRDDAVICNRDPDKSILGCYDFFETLRTRYLFRRLAREATPHSTLSTILMNSLIGILFMMLSE
jgi:hypothetical protein